MEIKYQINENLSADDFINVLKRSGLAERRPVDDRECIEGMLAHGNLLVSARVDGVLVGIARAVTDFHYACYLSDLAVDQDFQSRGIGIELQRRMQKELGPRCKLILIAAPRARGYYPKIGYRHNPNCWVLGRDQKIGEIL